MKKDINNRKWAGAFLISFLLLMVSWFIFGYIRGMLYSDMSLNDPSIYGSTFLGFLLINTIFLLFKCTPEFRKGIYLGYLWGILPLIFTFVFR